MIIFVSINSIQAIPHLLLLSFLPWSPPDVHSARNPRNNTRETPTKSPTTPIRRRPRRGGSLKVSKPIESRNIPVPTRPTTFRKTLAPNRRRPVPRRPFLPTQQQHAGSLSRRYREDRDRIRTGCRKGNGCSNSPRPSDDRTQHGESNYQKGGTSPVRQKEHPHMDPKSRGCVRPSRRHNSSRQVLLYRSKTGCQPES